MKKRIISFLLALVLVLGLIPATATTANAASSLSTSAKAIDILKGSVTFYDKVKDGKVGYSTPISAEDEAIYLNGISKEDASDLLRSYLKRKVDAKINAFTKQNNIDLNQNEHDALAVRIFRSGTLNDCGLFEAVRSIKTVNSAADRAAIVNAFVDSRTHTVHTYETMLTTLNVSLAEAAMYLYGDYGYNGSSKLAHVRLMTKGDKIDDVVAYVKADGLALPKSGLAASDFLGWFVYDGSKKEAVGAPITKVTKDHDGKVIIAKKATGGNVAAEYTINTKTLSDLNVYSYGAAPEKTGVMLKNNTDFKVTYEFIQNENGESIKWVFGTGKNTKNKDVSGWVKIGKVGSSGTAGDKPIATATVTVGELIVRKGATSGSDQLDKLTKNEVVNVYEIKVEKTETGNQNWGKIKLDDGTVGWINLAYAEVNETLGESGKPEGQTGKIANADDVNIRSNAAITATNKITSLKRGTKVTVLEMNADRSWAKIKWADPSNGYTQGWVYMHYVQLDSAYAGSDGGFSGDVKYTGVVTSNINLNVRKSADIYSAKVDSLPNGTKINIYETVTSRNMKWGRIGENRWVCLTYVSLTEVQQPAGGSSTTTTTSLQATVTSATLDVLKNYNNNAEKVGSLKKGDVVTILEKNTENTGTGSRIWGRISKDGVEGWINLAYVELKNVASVNGSTNSGATTGTTNSNGASAVIANCISVNVREGAGVSNAQITKLNNGTAVKVYDRVTKDNAPWAKITWNNGANSGWVCMNYVEMSTAGTGTTEGGLINGTNSNTISATGIVNSNIDLNVRSIAGLNGIKLGALKKGTKVTVYEQVSADGMIWGRIPYGNGSGWICMSYISIESASSTGKGVMGTIARCFAAVNVRSAPGTNNALINKIAVGTRVEVFETKQHGAQLWGRVAQGWICMDYVLLDSELPPGTALDATVPTTEATKATEPEETINRDNEIGYTINGTVKTDNGGSVYVRNDASTDSDKVGTVNHGLDVKILALKNNNAELWGRIDQYATAGWIRMDYVDYSVKGYVNTDEQPVYATADTTSTIKENLSINTYVDITKLTVGGETVYGWVNAANGWIPMGRISDEKVDVIPVYKQYTHSFGEGKDVTTGTTNTATDIVDVINGSKVVFKLQSGVKVPVGELRAESRTVWGKLIAHDVTGWIDMAKVNFTISGNVTATKLEVWTGKDTSVEDDILGYVAKDAVIQICGLSFDSYGNLWGTVSKATVADPETSEESVVNGGYVLMDYVESAVIH